MIIWLASYPRSGNTAVRVLLNHAFNLKTYSIYNDLLDIGADRKTSNIVGHRNLPTDWAVEAASSDQQMWIVKSHDYPIDGNYKAIYVVRDGREVSVSYLNYLQTYTDQSVDLSQVVMGFVPFGSWSDHVSVWDPKNRLNTLLINYEKLVEDPTFYIIQIAEFIGIDPTAKKVPEFSELHNINPTFFFRGKTDSWKADFPQDLHALFWFIHGEEMVKYDYIDDKPKWADHSKKRIPYDSIIRSLKRALGSSRQHIEKNRIQRLSLDQEKGKLIRSLKSNEEQLKGMIQSLEVEGQSMETKIISLTTKLEKLRQSNISFKDEIEQQTTMINDLENQSIEHKDAIRLMEKQSMELSKEIDNLEVKSSELSREIDNLEVESSVQINKISSLEENSILQDNIIRSYEREIHKIISSRSWRYTSFLRMLGHYVRNLM